MHTKPDLRVPFVLNDYWFRLGDRGRYPEQPLTEREHMPASFDDVYSHLEKSVARIHGNWKFLIELFGTDDALKLFNDTDPVAAAFIHNAIVEKTVLDIAKLRDPATSGNFENLSFRSAVAKLKQEYTDADTTTIDNELDQFLTDTEPFRDLRNKQIAHSDSATLLDPASAVAGIPRTDIENVISQTESIMNHIGIVSGKSHVIYSATAISGGGTSLSGALRYADRYFEISDLATSDNPDIDKIIQLAQP